MSTESVMYRHIIIKLSNYLYILVFTRMNLSFQQCESLLHSFFAENTLTEIAYLVVPAGWFFPAAATWFFFSFFSKMGVCLTFFVGSGVSWRLTYNGVRLNLYSNYWLPLQQGLPDFQLLRLQLLCLYHPFLILEGIKEEINAVFCQWSRYALKGLELVTVHVCCVMWAVLTEICEIMEIIVV